MTTSEQGLAIIMRIIAANKMLGDRELTPIRKAIKTYGDLRVCERLGEMLLNPSDSTSLPNNVIQFSKKPSLKDLANKVLERNHDRRHPLLP